MARELGGAEAPAPLVNEEPRPVGDRIVHAAIVLLASACVVLLALVIGQQA